MAKAGRHLNTGPREKRRRRPAAKRRRASLPVIILRLVIVVAFAVVMLSPLRGCSISGRDYIGTQAAVSLAAESAGIPEDKLTDLRSGIIMLDEKAYYKVDFTAADKQHSIIVNAVTGSVKAYKAN